MSSTLTGVRSVDEMDEAEVREHLAKIVRYMDHFDMHPKDDHEGLDREDDEIATAAHWALWVHRSWDHVKAMRAEMTAPQQESPR